RQTPRRRGAAHQHRRRRPVGLPPGDARHLPAHRGRPAASRRVRGYTPPGARRRAGMRKRHRRLVQRHQHRHPRDQLMDFTLSDDQQLLRDTARGLLEKECPSSLVRAYEDDVSVADRLWEHLLEWTELGRGPLVDLCLFLEETGAVLVPGPFFASSVLWSGLGLDGVGTVAFIDDLTMPYTIDADRVEHIAIVGPEGAVVTETARLSLR